MIGGKVILKSFRKDMMEDKQLSIIVDYEDSGACFNGQHIDGGICYFLWDKNHYGRLTYKYAPSSEQAFISKRYLREGDVDIVIRDIRRQTIITKTLKEKSFSLIVSARKPFGINTDIFNNKENYSEYKLSESEFPNSVLIWGVKGIKGGAKRVVGYIDFNAIPKNKEYRPYNEWMQDLEGFTFSTGDYIVKGEVIEDIITPNNIRSVIEKYKPNAFEIRFFIIFLAL